MLRPEHRLRGAGISATLALYFAWRQLDADLEHGERRERRSERHDRPTDRIAGGLVCGYELISHYAHGSNGATDPGTVVVSIDNLRALFGLGAESVRRGLLRNVIGSAEVSDGET